MSGSSDRGASPTLVAGRAFVLGFAGAILAAAGHWVAGWSRPSPELILAAGVLASLLLLPLLGRERGLLWTLALLVACQGLTHLVLTAGPPGSGHAAMDNTHASPPMLAVHAMAVLLAAWWLRRGEVAVWRRARRAVEIVSRTLASHRPPVRAVEGSFVASIPHSERSRPVLRPLAESASGRGPPLRPIRS